MLKQHTFHIGIDKINQKIIFFPVSYSYLYLQHKTNFGPQIKKSFLKTLSRIRKQYVLNICILNIKFLRNLLRKYFLAKKKRKEKKKYGIFILYLLFIQAYKSINRYNNLFYNRLFLQVYFKSF